MTPEELAALFEPGYEGRGYEFKGAVSRGDVVFFAKVTRAALGLANRAGGGVIVIGVDEGPEHKLVLTGLTDDLLASWNYDDVAAGFAAAADPRFGFGIETVAHDEKQFRIVTVHEFEDVPILCRKNFNHGRKTILRDGALYVRTRGKPETSEVPTQTEMREVLDLAIDKGVRTFLARSERVGLAAVGGNLPADADQYAAERDEPDA